jgi:hypothetical protein
MARPKKAPAPAPKQALKAPLRAEKAKRAAPARASPAPPQKRCPVKPTKDPKEGGEDTSMANPQKAMTRYSPSYPPRVYEGVMVVPKSERNSPDKGRRRNPPTTLTKKSGTAVTVGAALLAALGGGLATLVGADPKTVSMVLTGAGLVGVLVGKGKVENAAAGVMTTGATGWMTSILFDKVASETTKTAAQVTATALEKAQRAQLVPASTHTASPLEQARTQVTAKRT